MKKLVVFVLAIILAFGFCSCSNGELDLLSSDSSKLDASTKLSVKMPKKTKKDEPIVVKIGMGKTIYSKYNNYIETNLSIDAQGAVIDGCNDCYFMTFDITEEKYLCTKKDKPRYFIEISLDFSNCEQTSGTISISLVSYSLGFESKETDGQNFYIDYTIKDNYIRFSSK